MQFRPFVSISHLALVCALAGPVAAQSFMPSSVAAVEPGFDEGRIVVDVSEVQVFFNVRQRDRLVQGLNATDFRVLEDNRPQTIKFFAENAQEPLSLAILVDSSTSQSRVLEQEKSVGHKFLSGVLAQGDEALVVGFDSYIQMFQDFSTEQDRLVAAIGESSLGARKRTALLDFGPVPKLRSTALYDAIVATSRQRMSMRLGHKAMVIVTDGEDNGSRTHLADAIQAAQRADTICYVLLVADKSVRERRDYRGVARMKELAAETGGRLITVGKKVDDMERSFSEVAYELRHQYTLAYTPRRNPERGDYRTIQVLSRHGYQVQARKGYFASKFSTRAAGPTNKTAAAE